MATQTKEVTKRQETPIDRLKKAISGESVQAQFKNALAENAPLFVASLIDVYASDTNLQKCAPNLVIMEALKAATLKLPINKGLGFAYIVPYKNTPQMQIGYKGYIQLAMRTGQYRYLNSGALYEGHTIDRNLLTGEVKILGTQTSDKTIGYFAYMELLNGFSKSVCWTKEEVRAHAKKFSKSYSHPSSTWKSDFDAMATKTMIRNLLSKYGVMSVEMVSALDSDTSDDDFEKEIEENANTEIIDLEVSPEDGAAASAKAPDEPPPMTEEEKQAIIKEEQEQVAGPDF